MEVHFVPANQNPDFNGPVLDIIFTSPAEAFELGRLFQRLAQEKKCVWKINSGFRVPLIDVNEIGLAVLPTG